MLVLRKINNLINVGKKIVRSSNTKQFRMEHNNMFAYIKQCIPTLDEKKHKGQAGRIGIVGGSLEYTGAPYFAGISALKVGADLVHVFCTSSASTVIKSYSPELIVHPLLDTENATTSISPWLDRLHAVVIGPGLGRDKSTLSVVSELIEIIQNKKIPMVIDADGLFLLTEKPDLIRKMTSIAVLTPNKVEFDRLSNSVSGLNQISKNIVILKKSAIDELITSNSEVQWKNNLGGSGRRCGGQGDLLSGSIATFLHWTLSNINTLEVKTDSKDLMAASLSCYAASALVRKSNEKAFKTKGRSMLASDMIEYIHESFEELFGQ